MPDTIATGEPCRPAVHSRAAVWVPEWPCRGSTIQRLPGHGLPTSRPEGGAIPGHPLVGGTSQELAGHHNPGGGKRVEWAAAASFAPSATGPPWTHGTLPVSGKNRRQMGISPRAPTPMQPIFIL